MAASIDGQVSEPDPVAQLGYDPDQYELVDDDETESDWVDDEPEPQAAEEQVSDQATATLDDFHKHLDELEAQYGHAITTAERRAMVLDSIERGGLAPDTTEQLFYRRLEAKIVAGEDAAAAEEQDRADRLRSKDPIVRRNARRERMVRAIDQGGGWA